jgi:predicted transcriptional regulator
MDTPENLDLRAIHRAKYDEWFLREVDTGIAAADRGKFVQHLDVRELIDERYPG